MKRRETLLGTSALRPLILTLAMAALLSPTLPNLSQANPSGSQVVSGGVTITAPTDSDLVVRQSTNSAIINWQGFSIGSGERTQFRQPSRQAVTLNRVVGGDLSRIDGQLQANGNLFLVNPNGVIFGSGARVDVGGLVATTADIANDDFLSGRYDFAIASPDPDAMVINHGTISIAEQGLAALVAPGVENRGLIVASLGSVTLGGAETFSLDLTGDGLLAFGVTGPVTQTPADATALVNNSGTISAVGGSVVLSAEAAGAVVDNVINMSGVIEAQSAGVNAEGHIVLSGGATGLVEVSGALDASGAGAGQRGGQVQVLGELVALRDGANVDVSGSAGGGAALVGGNFQGAGPLPNARRTLVEQGASINADATVAGNGGTVIVWADEVTGFMGSISARGGPAGGDGGLVETSGKQGLHVQGAVVDVSAPFGLGGQWLLDPDNVDVVAGGGALPPILFGSSPGLDLTVDPASLNVAAGSTVVVQAEFDIDIIDPITTSGSLVFQAGDEINVGADIATNGGDLHFEAGSPHASAAGAGVPDGDPAFLNIDGDIFGSGEITIDTGGGNAVLIAEAFNLFDGATDADIFQTGGGNLTIAKANVFEDQAVQAFTVGGAGSDITPDEFDLFAVGGTLTLGQATTAGSDGLGTGAQIITNSTLTVEGDLTGAVSPLFGTIGLLHLLGETDVSIEDAIDTARVLVNSGGTINLLDPINVTGDSAFQAAGDLTLDSSAILTSNGANLFFEADSPHAGAGSDGVGTLLMGDDPLINTGGGDLVLMGADFDFSTAVLITSGSGDTFVAGSTDALFDLGGSKSGGVLQTSDLEFLDGTIGSPTTGNIIVGEATSSGTDGLGTGAVTRQATSILLDGTVLLNNAASLIFSSSGSVTQTAGSGVTADSLGVMAGDTVDLGGDVDTFAVDALGQTVEFVDSDDLDIGTVDSIVGATATTLSFAVGTNLTNSSAISATNLVAISNFGDQGGTIDLTADVDTLAGSTENGTFIFNDPDEVDIGSVTGVGLTVDGLLGAALVEITVGGGLTNSQTFEADQLAVTAGGDVILFGDFDEIAVSAPDFLVDITDPDGLDIGFVSGVSGLTADRALVTVGGDLTIASPVDVDSTSAFRAGGFLSTFTNIASNGADLFFEADSPHAPNGSDGNGSLTIGDGTDLDTAGGDLTLMGSFFSFANASSISSGTGDTFVAGSTDGLFDLGGSKFDTLRTADLLALDGSQGSPTTGNIIVGEATSSGTDGLGTGAVTRQATSIFLDGTVLLTNAASLTLSSSGSVTQSAGSGVTVTALGVIAGGDVDLGGDVDVLAVDAPGHDVAFDDIDDLTVGTVRDITGITAENVLLEGGTITFDVAHLINASLEIVSDSTNTVIFDDTLDGPGDLFIFSKGDVLFNAAVGGSEALGNVIIGAPITTFDDVAATLVTEGLEAASAELLNEGGDVVIAGLFRADDVLIKVNGTITSGDDPSDALDVSGLLVSGASADLHGFLDGIGDLTAAQFGFSDPPLILDPLLGFVFGAFDPTAFLLNDCIIETVCGDPSIPPDPDDPGDPDDPILVIDDPLIVEEDVNSITHVNSNTSDDIKAAEGGPSLDFVTIFEPSGNEQQEFDERFSNTGNEEIW